MMRSKFKKKYQKHTSKDLRIDISIKNELGIVRSGSTLEGTAVLLFVGEDNDDESRRYEGGPMKLYVTGREWVKKKGKLGGKKRESERIFCALDVDLGDLTGQTLAIYGSAHVFPFKIHMPPKLPSSTSFTAGDLKMKIEYKLLVTGCYATAEQEFIVASSPLPDERVPCMEAPVTFHLNQTVTGKGQGPISFCASVADTHVGRGDILKVNLATRNDSAVDIQKIELKIQEIVSSDTKVAAYDGENNVYGDDDNPHHDPDHTFKEDLYSESIVHSEGLLEKRHSRIHANQAFLRSSQTEEHLFNELYEELVLDKHQYNLTCPAKARDSYQGRLIRVQHCLKVKLWTDALTDNPSITIPLQIGYPPERDDVTASERSFVQQPRYLALPAPAVDEEADRALAQAIAAADAPQERFLALPPSQPDEATDRALAAALAADDMARNTGTDTTRANFPDLLALPPSTTTTPSAPSAPTTTNGDFNEEEALAAALAESASMAANNNNTQELLALPAPPHTQDIVIYAEPIPANAMAASVVSVAPDVVTLGGDAIVLYDSEDDEEEGNENDANDNEPAEEEEPMTHSFAPQLNQLFEEMLISVEDYAIIESKLRESTWSIIFEAMSPNDYGSIVAHVNRDFDQPRVAALLAPIVHGSNNFTCKYCAAAVKNASDWNKLAMLEKLLPLCVDLEANQQLIKAELSEWDLVVCEPKFTEHLMIGPT